MPARLELAGRAEALAAAGTPFVWATVVRAERPTSANLGIQRWCSQTARSTGSSVGIVPSQRCGSGAGGTRDRHAATPADHTSAEEVRPPDEDDVVAVHNPCLSGGALDIFLEPSVPLPVVAVFGHARSPPPCCVRIGSSASKSYGWRSPMTPFHSGHGRW